MYSYFVIKARGVLGGYLQRFKTVGLADVTGTIVYHLESFAIVCVEVMVMDGMLGPVFWAAVCMK